MMPAHGARPGGSVAGPENGDPGAARGEAVLRAVAHAAQRFLESNDWREVIPEALAHLGEAADASRAYVASVDALEDDVRDDLLFEWTAPHANPVMGHPDLHGGSLVAAGLGRWVELLARGETIDGPVGSLPASERAFLASIDVRSLVAVPVFAGSGWWGYVGFDECRSDRAWSASEIDALRTAAGILGAAIHRRRVDDRLRRTEDRYRDLVERIPAITYQELVSVPDDLTPSIVYVSPQVRGVLGYSSEEWRDPRTWARALHPDDRDRVVAESERTGETGEPYAQDYRLIAKDGRVVWVHDEAVKLGRDEQGRDLWQGVMIDVTPLKQAEERLQEAEERFRTLVEQNPAVIYTQVIDPGDPSRSNTVYISPGTEVLLGYTVEETLADPGLWREILHPDDRERVLAADAETNQTGAVFDLEYRMISKDGRVVWIHDRATLIGDGLGRPRFWHGFMLDITERKQAEEAVQRALEAERAAIRRMREIDEMKNTFLQAVSHDLRTPLASILGLALTLERADLDLEPEEGRELAGRIAENARKLDRLVTDLLDLDRLSRGIVEPKLAPTDVGALVRRVVVGSDLLDGRSLQVQAEAVVVDADAAKVERIVENLLSNTARHTPPDTRVWVRVACGEGGALIEVADDGPGVPEDLRRTVFEPFRQGATTDATSPGMGVGLALVARFAEIHGGRAWVEQREGGGASFRVFLPARRRPVEAGI